MRHFVTAFGAVLAGAILSTAIEAPARADEPGFSVRVTAPGDFTAGEAAKTVTAVVTSENRRCRKVRWALLVHSGLDDDQLKVVRIEEDGEFGTSSSTEGITTTFLDDRPDPGTLCRGRTVTGRWQVAFAGPDAGQVQFEARAFDAQGTLLTAAGATTQVESDTPPPPSPSPSPSREEQAPADEPATEPPAAQQDRESGDPQAALVSEDSFLLGPGLIVGGVFVFLGVLLLLRIRSRSRAARREAQVLPTGFYRMPR
ncbi:hypothetical protein ACTI_80080 [Actinoplanes sp. OR16]|uniref:hypothetical protein n=1 Tax=Actinoplanes sp. OR16 TaxID=946334 RepID=UPI000F6C5357|nr:hypothetical protein [Actinoplanes sp. OR16]BBH71323.1 hypothetical protein ACTI_80080 [Actinoplanes sp. OR16]